MIVNKTKSVTHRHENSVTRQPSFSVINQEEESVTHRVNHSVTE